MTRPIDDLRREFLHFAEVCTGQSPLYAELSRRIADVPRLLALAAGGQPGQPPANLLLGAVHDLLLAGTDHELARYYPSVGGHDPPEAAWPDFVDFCVRFEDPIVHRVATRRVQTNEVGRCGVLLPGFALAWKTLGRRALHLVEVGCSAGLNLRFDRYRYEYTRLQTPDGAALPVHRIGPPSDVVIRTELRGSVPLPAEMPSVAERVGIDLAPVDVSDLAAAQWLEALTWPDQPRRLALLRAAIAAARSDPPRILGGGAIDLLPGVVESGRRAAAPCVFHSFVAFQMEPERRQRLWAIIDDLGRRRDLAHLSLEWLGDDAGPKLHLSICTAAGRHTTHLADCHHHGAWLHWTG